MKTFTYERAASPEAAVQTAGGAGVKFIEARFAPFEHQRRGSGAQTRLFARDVGQRLQSFQIKHDSLPYF